MDIPAFLEAHEKLLQTKLDQARASTAHTTQKGNILEDAIRGIMKDFLPDKIGVTEGIVIDSTGYASPQIDVILYDAIGGITFVNGDQSRVVPAEFVLAVGEVKASLNKRGYDNFHTAQEEVKNCERSFVKRPTDNNTYFGYGKNWSVPPIISFIICFEAKPDIIQKHWIDSHIRNAVNNCIDTIVCPGKFQLRRAHEEYGAELLLGKVESLQLVKDAALLYFLGMMFKTAVAWKIHEDAAIYKYFSASKGIPNSSITKFKQLSVAHRYLKN